MDKEGSDDDGYNCSSVRNGEHYRCGLHAQIEGKGGNLIYGNINNNLFDNCPTYSF